MKLIANWTQEENNERPKTVFTIGVFDGLHLGHKCLVKSVIKLANKLNAQAQVLTFEPHPLAVLAPQAAPPVLTTLEQKAEILASWGLDSLGVLRFTKELAQTPGEKFLNQCLGKFINPVGAVLGPDFSYGQNAHGDVRTLETWLKSLNPKGQVIQLEPIGGEAGFYASSQVRQDLKSGLVESAVKSLGRPYQITGQVVHGHARGRTIGFPTANLGGIPQLIPEPGVYAVSLEIEGKSYDGMCSVGYNPTFGEQPMTVEINIFDFDSFIYGQPLAVSFIARLRSMVRFKSVDQLVSQLEKDRHDALKILRPIVA